MGVRRGQGEERAAGGVGWAPWQPAARGEGLWGGPPRGQGPRWCLLPRPPARVVDAPQHPEPVCAALSGELTSGRKAGAVEGPTSVCAAAPGVPAWDHAYLSRASRRWLGGVLGRFTGGPSRVAGR